MSLLMAFTIKDMIPLMLNTEVKEAIRMVANALWIVPCCFND